MFQVCLKYAITGFNIFVTTLGEHFNPKGRTSHS